MKNQSLGQKDLLVITLFAMALVPATPAMASYSDASSDASTYAASESSSTYGSQASSQAGSQTYSLSGPGMMPPGGDYQYSSPAGMMLPAPERRVVSQTKVEQGEEAATAPEKKQYVWYAPRTAKYAHLPVVRNY